MAKKKPDMSFDFGANVNRGRKPKRAGRRRQTSLDRQAYAIARRTGQLPYGGS